MKRAQIAPGPPGRVSFVADNGRDRASAWGRSSRAVTNQCRMASIEFEARESASRSCKGRTMLFCTALCESGRFTALTTVMTFYALFGDDSRLCFTHKQTDDLFNVVTVLCIFVFALEVFASSVGKAEYFNGFFFWLDVISTVTLALDLTWIGNIIFCATEGGAANSAASTSRAGRAGARASRTVRILRLIRLVKLYKQYKAAMDKKKAAAEEAMQQNRPSVLPGDETPSEPKEDPSRVMLGDGMEKTRTSSDSGSDVSDDSDSGDGDSETRVGKKLSDMTTRRVIILVLVMLFCMPQFAAESWGGAEFRTSAALAVETIYQRWSEWCMSNGATAARGACLSIDFANGTFRPPLEQTELRWLYERSLLRFLYTHQMQGLSWRLYWVGLNSEELRKDASQEGAYSQLGNLGRLAQPRLLDTETRPADEWDGIFARQSWQSSIAAMPETTKTALTDVWQERCDSYVGVRVFSQAKPSLSSPMDCSITQDLRCSEHEWVLPLMLSSAEGGYTVLAFNFDKRAATTLEAGLSMIQTIFICITVGVGSMGFNNDANRLLLDPIKRMIAKMETIKDHPLESMRLGDLEFRREEAEAARRKEEMAKKSKLLRLLTSLQSKKSKEPMETVILEKTIIKLGALLAMGFGEGSSAIVGTFTSGSDFLTTASGRVVDCVVAFASVRDFDVCLDCLGDRSVIFLNQVCEIVHGCADDYHGNPIKNYGDSFLCTWTLAEEHQGKEAKLCDLAVVSLVKVIAAINRSPLLEEYRSNPAIRTRTGRPEYQVELGCSLHKGSAVEGCVGSEFKLDVVYMGPNVNVCKRLQTAACQYGVHIVLSHNMALSCSPQMLRLFRVIDHVKIRGYRKPIRLYTIDLDVSRLEPVDPTPRKVIRNRFRLRQFKFVRKNALWADEIGMWSLFETDKSFAQMRSTYTQEFFQRFATGYRNYEAGQWYVARDMLYTCHYQPRANPGDPSQMKPQDWPRDGPVIKLLQFMRERNFVAPTNWPGYRELQHWT
eukprot:TRINITY_DN90327_c0_g1_i1.p1 TRINITY_DN90327_c0_g1~~TRINITY_DN90327_c0_g1_i1.p1  ORF type:complete len:1004 (-),score=166.35 TRINITY_DN90327_c0_g1_i1:92-3103(-)